MPALGSRSLRKDAGHRRSTLTSYALFEGDSRHSSATGLSAPPHHEPSKRAASVDVPRSNSSSRVRRMSAFVDPAPPSPPRESRPQTPRFSLLRFRNASEPQLSTKAREHAIQPVPPVPAVPASEFATYWQLLLEVDIDLVSPGYHNNRPNRRDGRLRASPFAAETIQIPSFLTAEVEQQNGEFA